LTHFAEPEKDGNRDLEVMDGFRDEGPGLVGILLRDGADEVGLLKGVDVVELTECECDEFNCPETRTDGAEECADDLDRRARLPLFSVIMGRPPMGLVLIWGLLIEMKIFAVFIGFVGIGELDVFKEFGGFGGFGELMELVGLDVFNEVEVLGATAVSLLKSLLEHSEELRDIEVDNESTPVSILLPDILKYFFSIFLIPISLWKCFFSALLLYLIYIKILP